ncbi:MAG: TSUP family transporter [Dehalococcoidia bacterium]
MSSLQEQFLAKTGRAVRIEPHGARGATTTPDLSWTTLGLVFVIVLAASTIKGTIAFGLNLVAIPLLLLLVEPRLAVVLIVPLSFILDLSIIHQTWSRIHFRRIIPMVLLGALGIPLGLLILLATPGAALKLFIAAVILVAATLLALGFSPRITRERLASGIVGFSSGLLSTSTGIAAPPVALFLMNQQVEKDEFRPSLSSFLVMVNFMATVSFAISGSLWVPLHVGSLALRPLLLDLILLPAALLGFFVASRLLPYINPFWFRRGIILVVIAAAISAIVSTVVTL